MLSVFVDRRHIRYQPPFSAETFSNGFTIGVDASGYNCVRFRDWPLAYGSYSQKFVEQACEALNAQPMADVIEAQVDV